MRRPKKTPLRTCVGCRTVFAKNDLVRLVRRPDGAVVMDATGKLPGRGAYICRSRNCLEVALKRKHLERSLKGDLTSETVDQLLADIEQTD